MTETRLEEIKRILLSYCAPEMKLSSIMQELVDAAQDSIDLKYELMEMDEYES